MARAILVAVLAFLYLPILVIVVFSFNEGENLSRFTGLTLHWYEAALGDSLAREALWNSVNISLSTALISTAIGTATALGLREIPTPLARFVRLLLFIGLTAPGIVIGLATLVALATFIDQVERLAFALGMAELRPELGRWSVVLAHTLFCTALVVELVTLRLRQIPPSLIEASADLGRNQGDTFLHVVLPQLRPAMLAGFLVSLVFSFDEFIIAFFVSGTNSTLPVYLFGYVRRGATPIINAVAVMILVSTIALLLTAFWAARPFGRRASGLPDAETRT